MKEESIKEFFSVYGMYEVLTNVHNNTPETYVRNNQYKTIDGIWISAGINPLLLDISTITNGIIDQYGLNLMNNRYLDIENSEHSLLRQEDLNWRTNPPQISTNKIF